MGVTDSRDVEGGGRGLIMTVMLGAEQDQEPLSLPGRLLSGREDASDKPCSFQTTWIVT